MNIELQQKLYQDFPELFAQKDLDPYQSCMHWGLECGDGWEPIIRHVCRLLASRSKHNMSVRPRKLKRVYHRLQVKFHNFCRKLEKYLDLKTYSLYRVEYPVWDTLPGWDIQFAQIKEKFGSLRIYYDLIPRFTEQEMLTKTDRKTVDVEYYSLAGYIDGVLAFANNLSEETCEIHGIKGKLDVETRWWKVRCPECKSHEQINKPTNKDS